MSKTGFILTPASEIPAFPQPQYPMVDASGAVCGYGGGGPGMSLRDYFAAKALQGMLAYSHVNPFRGNYHENCSHSDAAKIAYSFADAMLAEREAKSEPTP